VGKSSQVKSSQVKPSQVKSTALLSFQFSSVQFSSDQYIRGLRRQKPRMHLAGMIGIVEDAEPTL
jgi:hypothetical protein